ncbi:MAG TPA: hypothetical protein VFW29_05160 [Solirubrobacteraceae bacterium]|nr:hypothetical protein [Solirubrobacteraceae bacterium]
MTRGHPRAVYLGGDDGGDRSVFGVFHPAAPGGRTGVVMCPPFGWDDTCSYRSRRDWAEARAEAGMATIRIDFPGTGDSAGSPDDGPLATRWTGAVLSAVESLQALSGCVEIAAVGIGLGGLMLVQAAAEGAPLRDLVLWAVPASGRTLVRELRVFASLEESGPAPDPATDADPLPEGSVWAGGFLLRADTASELEALDLTRLDLTGTSIRRVLLLGRDGISVDSRLRSHLLASGFEVDVSPGEGYGAMMAKPHYSRTPTEVVVAVSEWLGPEAAAAPGGKAGPGAAQANGAAVGPPARTPISQNVYPGHEAMLVAGGAVRERALAIEQPFGELFGILAEPTSAPVAEICAILLNAGAIRRIGPNRTWVEAARRWAACGVRTLRLDLEGIGDADGDAERFSELAELYTPRMTAQVGAALGALAEGGLAHSFVLGGLCSGAYWAFHATHADERVRAAFLLNPQALVWDPSLETARELRKGMRGSSMRRILSGEVPIERLVSFASQAPRALPRRLLKRRGDRAVLFDALATMAERDQHVTFLFSGKEPLLEELQRDGSAEMLMAMPNVAWEALPGEIHTLRPREAQRRAHEALDRALQAVLAGTHAGHAVR